eukprot:CAMPEP_0184706130 /NCGR_PEP_ID=MMETSP0313-20130426/36597_1 /TAXON_ID=2792 /ORGANISM="Porphyridium aerugineum, Strain SAG 1380-2" /LENGTH=497 /DNA_ID=CAMNT_0027167677 /DNA_START=334 /DNA_END=1827 /DNA_ORIENTATION=-
MKRFEWRAALAVLLFAGSWLALLGHPVRGSDLHSVDLSNSMRYDVDYHHPYEPELELEESTVSPDALYYEEERECCKHMVKTFEKCFDDFVDLRYPISKPKHSYWSFYDKVQSDYETYGNSSDDQYNAYKKPEPIIKVIKQKKLVTVHKMCKYKQISVVPKLVTDYCDASAKVWDKHEWVEVKYKEPCAKIVPVKVAFEYYDICVHQEKRIVPVQYLEQTPWYHVSRKVCIPKFEVVKVCSLSALTYDMDAIPETSDPWYDIYDINSSSFHFDIEDGSDNGKLMFGNDFRDLNGDGVQDSQSESPNGGGGGDGDGDGNGNGNESPTPSPTPDNNSGELPTPSPDGGDGEEPGNGSGGGQDLGGDDGSGPPDNSTGGGGAGGSESGGLSAGAIAGIVVGAVLASLSLLAILYGVRKRRQAAAGGEAANETGSTIADAAEGGAAGSGSGAAGFDGYIESDPFRQAGNDFPETSVVSSYGESVDVHARPSVNPASEITAA